MNTEVKTLQELSFEIIRNNFTRYTVAHNVTKDDALKKHLCFLQRVYSQNLFSELVQKEELEEQHFDFILNEHLKKLRIECLFNCSSKEKVIEKVSPIAHSLQELSCYCEYRYEEDYIFILKELIPHSKNVEKICIPFICNDDLLKLIGSFCTNLLELNIEETSNVTGAGIKALCLDTEGQVQARCPLKHLNLTGIELENEDVAFVLKNVPTLEEVLYSKLPEVIQSIHLLDIDNNIVSDTKQYNLQSLDFDSYEDSSQQVKFLTICVERCPKVKKLSVPISSAEHLDLVSHFSNLENLSISCSEDQYEFDLNNLLSSKGRNLKVLSVENFSLSVTSLLEKCPNLEVLALKTVQYQALDKNSTKVLHRLRSLQLDSVVFLNYHCTDSVMALLNSSPNLESLSMAYCDFSESDIVAKLSTFTLNCNLSHMQFECTDIGVDLLQQFILNCNSIKSLSLENCDTITLDDVCMLNNTVEASNRKIHIKFTDDHSDYTYSDYEVDYDGDYDIEDYYGFEYYGDEEDYDDYEDYDGGYHPDLW